MNVICFLFAPLSTFIGLAVAAAAVGQICDNDTQLNRWPYSWWTVEEREGAWMLFVTHSISGSLVCPKGMYSSDS